MNTENVKSEDSKLPILVVIARFIPLIGIMWLPNNRYAKLFAIYHFFASGVIAIISMLYYLNVL
jgi:hypothetical protein